MDSYIRKAVIDVLEKNLVVSGLISIALSFILSAQLKSFLPESTIILWLISLFIVYGFRYTFTKQRQATNCTEQASLTVFRIGSLASGLVWGWCGFFFFLEADTVTRLYISFTLGGLAAGASSSLAADKVSFLFFTIPVLIPNIAANFYIGTEVASGMAIMLVLYLVYISFSSKTMGTTLTENLYLQRKAELSEKEVKKLAYYDQLTGLPNRFLFEDRLRQVISKHKRDGNKFALLFIDLDGFKLINDNYGHRSGDHLLIELSQRFQNSVRNEDTIARIGGDEFVGVLQNTDGNGAMKVAHKLLKAASTPIILPDAEVQVSASIGVAIYPDHAQTANDLLICSDNFMYNAKEQGKNKIVMDELVYE